MAATVAHSASLATSSPTASSKPIHASWLQKIAAAFRITAEVIGESQEEERSAHARLPFTDL